MGNSKEPRIDFKIERGLRMLKKRNKIIWKACICVILCLSILFSNMSVANASDLVTDSDMSFHTQNDLQLKKISSLVQYEISSGIQVEKLDENDIGQKQWKFSNLKKDSVVKMTWKKVGSYRGKEIGAIVTFSNFKVPSGYSDPVISCNNANYFVYGYNYWNIESMDVEFVFFYVDTGELVDIAPGKDANSGSYMTFSSMNVGEYVSPKDTSKDGYTAKDTVIQKEELIIDGVKRTIFAGTSNEGWEDMVGGERFERSSVAIGLSGKRHAFTVGQNGKAGYYYVWSYPATYFVYLSQPQAPIKTVNGENNYEADLEGEEIVYEVSQKIHTMGEDTGIKYKTLVFQDQLPEEVIYLNAQMSDGKGNLVSDGIVSYDKDSHTVTYEFSDEYLQNKMSYDGSCYRFQIHCKIRDGVAQSFENDAQVRFNDIPIISNSATVIPALSRSITITKRIQVSDINFANGTPVFFFQLQGTEKSGEAYREYQMVSFDPVYVSSHIDSDGWVEKSCTFSDLKGGSYLVQEESCSRYRLSDITDVTAGTVLTEIANPETSKVKFQLTGLSDHGTAKFQNEKYEWRFFSGSDSCVNQLGRP